MSAPNSFLRLLGLGVLGDDPKELELLENITQKTVLGKITWHKTSSSLVADAGGMQLSFVRTKVPYSKTSGGGGLWDMFTIRTPQGLELMRVEDPATNFFIMPATPPESADAPSPRSKILQAVDNLYVVADTKGRGEIDNAINTIKNL
jgi:hypothetical protein